MTIQQYASFDVEAAGLNATSKTNPALAKMVAAWENKNTKRAMQGTGFTLMAVSLAACGGSSDDAAATAQAVALAAANALTASESAKLVLATALAAEQTAIADAATLALEAALADTDTAEAATQAALEAKEAADDARDVALTATKTAEDAQLLAEQTQEAAELAAETANTAAEAAQAAELAAKTQAAEDVLAAETAQGVADDALEAQNAAIEAAGFDNAGELIAAFLDLITPVTTVLTAAADIPNLTLNSDTIDGSLRNSLQDADSLIDASTADDDVLNANVTVNTAAPTMRNIETVNVTGEFLTTGLDLSNTTGTTTLNLSTILVGGTATVSNASAAAAANIVSGDNISSTVVVSDAAGTGAAGVNIDAGASTFVNIQDSAGDDVYSVTLAADADFLSDLADAGDSVTLTLGGDVTTTIDALMGTLNVSSAVDATMTEATGLGDDTDFTGAGNIILSTTSDIASAASSVTSTGAGSLALTLTTVTNGDDVSTVAADVVNYAEATAGAVALTVSLNSTLNMVETATDTTIDLGAAGTLIMTVSEDQTSLTTGTTVTSLTMSATPDEDDEDIIITTLVLDAATVNVAIIGAGDLEITTLTNNNDDVISAGSMTGDLTIDDVAADTTIFLGTGTNNITTVNASEYAIIGNTGIDIIDLTGAADSEARTVGGNDVITLSAAGVTTLDVGAGDDTVITAGSADQITLGAGIDSVFTAADDDDYTIADFVAGTDTLNFSGAAGGDIDLSNTAVAAGVYAFDAAGGNFDVTLTGSTATDLSDSIILGAQATSAVNANEAVGDVTFTRLDAVTFDVTGGDFADVIEVAVDAASTITTGAGADIIIATSAATGDVEVSDFVAGTDTIILEGAAAAGDTIDLTAVTVAAGEYTFSTNHIMNLSNGGTALTATDLSATVQLGSSDAVFTLEDNGAATSVTGGQLNDYIALSNTGGSADTVVFIDNGGADTITNFIAGEDLLDFDSMTGMAAAGVDFAAADAKVGDAIDGEVYVFADEELTGVDVTFDYNGADDDAGLGSAEVLASAAAYFEAALTETTGETYIGIIMTGTTEATAYLIEADADGIDAANLTLLADITSDALITAGDIV